MRTFLLAQRGLRVELDPRPENLIAHRLVEDHPRLADCFWGRFCKGGLNNYEGGLNNRVVPVISARQRVFLPAR
jgi:hypothetical protein